MLRYAQSYRSIFNGPRWGAILMMFVIAAAQVTAALHVPVPESTPGDTCCPAELAAHATSAAAAHDCCDADMHAIHGDTQDSAAATSVELHEDCEDCASDCETGDCGSDCCHHPPLNSPLPIPARLVSDASAPFVVTGTLCLFPKHIPALFQPPRA
mgnify:CR=1 FL=1